MTNLRYIDTDADLEQACHDLADQPYLAVDTEFIREKTYYPVLCLIQLASPTHCFCIDPLALPDLSPLRNLLLDERITKVFHAARQDLEILGLAFGKLPAPVFDTQIAASLLGLGDQLGYANLVKHFLQVQLSKGHARTDWERRPLSKEQIEYAADDVRYLIELFPSMRQKLVDLGRLDWLQEDFADLTRPELYQNNPDQQWQRVSGIQKLKGAQLAILQELAGWREQQAQHQDKPRKWIISDDVLLVLALQAPREITQLERIRGINSGLVQRHGQTLLGLVEKGQSRPKQDWPQLSRRKTLSPAQEALLDASMAIVRLHSAKHQINHSALCSRHDLESIIGGDRQNALLHGWRRGIAGQAVLNFLKGQTSLSVNSDGELALSSDS